MSPADRETLRRKLTYLRKTLEELEPYRSLSKEDFFAEKTNLPIVERHLQTAIQSVMDCSRLLVMMMGWRRVREEEDAIIILPRHQVLTEELAMRMMEAKKFRNILVHEYTEVDPNLVYHHLKNDCVDLDEFVRAFEGYLQKHDV